MNKWLAIADDTKRNAYIQIAEKSGISAFAVEKDWFIAKLELNKGDVADFMEDYHLQPHQVGLVKRFLKELQLHKTQNVLKPYLNAAGFEERNVQQDLFCSFLDFGKLEV